MDGLLLGFIARELQDRIIGAQVDRVQQPEKDELHLLLRGHGGGQRLLLCASANSARAHLSAQSKTNPAEPPMFCMLLRKLLGGSRIAEIRQIGGDRVLEIDFDCLDELGERVRRTLVCEFMGRHSNLILRGPDGRILDSIRHVGADVSRVREVKPGLPYTPPPPQNKLDPATATEAELRDALASAATRLDKALADTIAGLGAPSAREIAFRLTGDEAPHLDGDARMALAGPLFALLSELPTYSPPVLLVDEDGDPVDLYPFVQARLDAAYQQPITAGISAAMDAFYVQRDKRERIKQKSASLGRSLRTHIERCQNKLAIHEDILAGEARIEEARISGELLTANMHLLHPGAVRAEVSDYYTGGTRVIPLDARLTPAQNAQAYYKQYQKLRAAQRHAKDQAEAARAELGLLESLLDDLRKCGDALELDEIRAELVAAGYLRAVRGRGKPKKPTPSKPLSVQSSDGLTIRIGRNSAQNDRLTAGAAPDWLWLHVKNMAGSHVIVECTGEIPEETLREAALLAAWYSRAYASAQVPVDYTRKKHVKKQAGAALGLVTYTHQRTLFVTPEERAVKRLAGEAPKG